MGVRCLAEHGESRVSFQRRHVSVLSLHTKEDRPAVLGMAGATPPGA